MLLVATWRLHRAPDPDFPDHHVSHGPLWVVDRRDPDALGEKLVVFEVRFTSREPVARIRRRHPDLRLFVRLADDVSGAEHDVPLDVPIVDHE
jgi:hypothetical protein